MIKQQRSYDEFWAISKFRDDILESFGEEPWTSRDAFAVANSIEKYAGASLEEPFGIQDMKIEQYLSELNDYVFGSYRFSVVGKLQGKIAFKF